MKWIKINNETDKNMCHWWLWCCGVRRWFLFYCNINIVAIDYTDRVKRVLVVHAIRSRIQVKVETTSFASKKKKSHRMQADTHTTNDLTFSRLQFSSIHSFYLRTQRCGDLFVCSNFLFSHKKSKRIYASHISPKMRSESVSMANHKKKH